jgi:hypothetical protein
MYIINMMDWDFRTAVPVFERRLYEMEEAEVVPEKVLALADEVEKEVQGGLCGRPLMSVPHMLADESAVSFYLFLRFLIFDS